MLESEKEISVSILHAAAVLCGLAASIAAFYFNLYDPRKSRWNFTPNAREARGFQVFFAFFFAASFLALLDIFWLNS